MQDLGSSEIFPSYLRHNSNGRFVVVCGDGEYVVYTALAWRNKSFGTGAEFVWALESNDFAVRQTKPDVIKVHKNFKVRPPVPGYLCWASCTHSSVEQSVLRTSRVWYVVSHRMFQYAVQLTTSYLAQSLKLLRRSVSLVIVSCVVSPET